MGKFNRKLSQLEAIYQIATPVLKTEDPVMISNFITTIFENNTYYELEHLTEHWFNQYALHNNVKATNFIYNILQENNQLISKKSILEGIKLHLTLV